MNAVGAALTLALCLGVALGSKRVAAICVVLAVCYLTQGQSIYVGFFTFTSIRIVLLVGLIRVIAKKELSNLPLSNVDRGLIGYIICLFIVGLIRVPKFETLVYQLGVLYNVSLSYLVCRGLLRQPQDIVDFLGGLSYLLLPLALLMIVEARTASTVFLPMGGFTEEFSVIRDGHVRCQGPFRQAITAGAFGATFALLYIGMLFSGTDRRGKMIVGMLASLVIVIAAHSSGPLLGLAIGVIALGFWKVRQYMRIVRWGLVMSIFALHLVMKDPVWFIVARIGDLIGGGGYHRAYLIDRFLNAFGDWWLVGSDNTSSWFPYLLDNGRADITNQFVSDGLNGGLLGLIFSIILVVRCYKSISAGMRASEELNQLSTRFVWAIGATLTGSIGILFSVTYFDQMHVIWYMVLACISVASGIDVNRSVQDQTMAD